MGKYKKFTIKLILLLFTFYILHLTFYIPYVYAHEGEDHGDNIDEVIISPASPLYFLTSIREILELKFANTTQAKGFSELEFAHNRISEVKSLTKTSRQDLIEPTLARYLFHLNELIGKITIKDENMVGKVTDVVVVHMSVLQDIYPQISNKRAHMSIRATINSLTLWDQQLVERLAKVQPIFAERILTSKLSGCSFLSREASAASNEVERGVLAERVQKCLSN